MHDPATDDRQLAAATLRTALHRSGLTSSALARRAGVSRALVRDYLTGAKQPSVAQLARVLRGAGLAPSIQLFGVFEPLTLRRLAAAVHLADDVRRWRLLQEFLRGYGEEPDRPRLVADEPDPVDDEWDALLGGLAEHLAGRDGYAMPAWCLRPSRFLDGWWFPGATDVADCSRLLATAPAALAARGVWLDRDRLARSR